MKKLVIIACVLSWTFAAWAQGNVEGIVSDTQTGQAVPYANCVLLRWTDSLFLRGTITDAEGGFGFDGLDTGRYLLRVSALGYATRHEEVEVGGAQGGTQGSETMRISVGLLPEATELAVVNVTETKPLYGADGEKALYHVADDPSVQTGTAMEALQNAPGVEVDAAGNIGLRGSTAVEVWVNDRPTHLEGEALKQYLKAMPAGSIKRIEVINNPSARYGSSGNAIINIVTSQRMVRNELFCVGLNAATTPSASPWASYVWANEKVNVSAWISGSYAAYNVDSENQEAAYSEDGQLSSTFRYAGGERQRQLNCGVGANVDWAIDTATTLSVWLGGYPVWVSRESHYDVEHWEYLYTPGNYSYRSDITAPKHFGGMWGGARWQRLLDTLGQRIDISLNSNYNRNHTVRNKARTYEELHQMDVMNRIDGDNSSFWNTLDLNYVKPYSKTGQVEMGCGAVVGRNNSSTLWDTLNHADGTQWRDADRTYRSRVADNEANAYLTVQQRIDRLVVKGGARLYRKWKHARFDNLPEPTSQYDVDKAFWDWIPSLHLTYSTPSGHNLHLSYTRRFVSPGATLWSPYQELAEESFSTGNPDLRFSHTHNLEGGWAWYQGWGSVSLTGYVHANTDEMQQLSDAAYHPYFGRIVGFSQYRNIGSSGTSGAELNVTWRPRPFMNVRLYADAYNYRYNMEFRPGEWQDTSMMAFSVRLNAWAKLWDKLQVFANANYRSQRLQLMSIEKPSFTLDLGLSADLFGRRLSMYLMVDDVLLTSRNGSSSTNPYYRTDFSYRYNSRAISLGLTWRIGKMELESKARQGGGSARPM